MTDEEKLDFVKYALVQKIESISTLDEFRQMTVNISPAVVRAFIISKLQDRAQSLKDSATAGNDVADKIGALIGEI